MTPGSRWFTFVNEVPGSPQVATSLADRLSDCRHEYLNLVELRVSHPILFDPFIGRDDMDMGCDGQAM